MKKGEYVLIPSLGNGVYKIFEVNNDCIIVWYDRDTKIKVDKNKVGKIMKAYI